MKNGILIFMMVMLMIGITKGQDYQWVIKEGKGINMNNTPSYPNNLNQPTSPIYFNNFKHPEDISSPPTQPRNDVFILFSDGTCFNSFNLPESGGPPAWPQPRMSSSPATKGFKIENPSAISYLYWTNLYEDDDDDDEKVSSTQESGQSPLTLSIYSNQVHPTISVNHKVFANTDITVIIYIPNDSCINYYLKYNECTIIDCPTLLTPKLDFFKNTNVETNVLHSTNTNEIKLNFNHHGYAYVNFSIADTVSGWAQRGALAKFSLYGEVIETCEVGAPSPSNLEIPILASHDPNFIRLDSICVKTSGTEEYYLNYYAQVQNTGNYIATNVYIQIPTLPEWDLNHLYITKLYYNGKVQPIEGSDIRFEIDENSMLKVYYPGALLAFNELNPFSSVAAFEFRVKVKESNIDKLKSKPVLFPENSKSNFSGVYYDITTFINLFSGEYAKNCDISSGVKVEKGKVNGECCWYYLCCNGAVNWIALFILSVIVIFLMLLWCRRRRRKNH